jgi:death-on-curing protein
VRALHARSLEAYGGLPGIRDEGMLESALGRPQNQFAYGGETDPSRLAAAYGFAIAKNHPFLDGNKRTSILVVADFLFANGYKLEAGREALYETVVAVASGAMDEAAFGAWIEVNSTER